MPPRESRGPYEIRLDRGPVDWAGALDRALDGQGVRTAYQPIVDLARRTVVGYEALSRFADPAAAGASPAEWFAAAYRLGCGEELEAVALRSALASRADLPRSCFLSINVEPDGLASPVVRRVLAAQGSLGGVVVELTEHRAWEPSDLEGPLNWLRAAGALVAVDDAGAGYAGLQQILRLRPQVLKLDRSLIEGVDRDESRVALVEMIGLFANRIDAWILAEGIETVDEANRLCDLGVPLAQGYLFARPGPPWPTVPVRVVQALAGFAERCGPTLHRLLEPVAPAHGVDDIAMLLDGGRWTPVIDGLRRPVGLLTEESAFTGEILDAVVANVRSSPTEVAHRVTTEARDPHEPVIVTDDAGRYLGLVSIRRLLGYLARSSGDQSPPGL